MWTLLLLACGEGPTGINEVGPGWVELYNGEPEEVRFDGWVLESAVGRLTVRTEDVTRPGEVVWVEADVVPDTGGTLELYDPEGSRVQRIDLPTFGETASYGRIPDGAANWQVLDTATPGGPNQP